MSKTWFSAALLGALAISGAAQATECGELRRAVAHLKAAAAIEESLKHAAQLYAARAQLKAAEKKLPQACAPKRATVSALPLGYVPVAPGNLSRASVQPGEGWRLELTTRAGARDGLVLGEPATLTLPDGLSWVSEPSPAPSGEELLVAVAQDAALTVEEPTPGRGVWSLQVAKPPALVPLSKLRACAAGKGDAGLKLSKASCAMLASIAPVPQPSALPERGRAVPLGEWQYGYRASLELSAEELQPGPAAGAARLELPLELSAPLPGITDGKVLPVTFEANQQTRPDGVTLKLGHGGCGDDDEKCEQARFRVEVWYDRVFGVPFYRVPPAGAAEGSLTGKVTDRLARAVANQRIRLTDGARKVVTITDDRGEFRFDALDAGDGVVVPVGKDPENVPKGDESRAVKIGLESLKVPVIFVNKLIE